LETRSDGEDARAAIQRREAEILKQKGDGEAFTQRLWESVKACDRDLCDAEDIMEINKIVNKLACLKEELLSLARGSKDVEKKRDSPKVRQPFRPF
jgi:hypothetical protein